jgi:hypothetical protein
MSVPPGQSPPVLRAGVRWAKRDLVWEFGWVRRQATWKRCFERSRQCSIPGGGAARAAAGGAVGGGGGGREGAAEAANGFSPPWLLIVQT